MPHTLRPSSVHPLSNSRQPSRCVSGGPLASGRGAVSGSRNGSKRACEVSRTVCIVVLRGCDGGGGGGGGTTSAALGWAVGTADSGSCFRKVRHRSIVDCASSVSSAWPTCGTMATCKWAGWAAPEPTGSNESLRISDLLLESSQATLV